MKPPPLYDLIVLVDPNAPEERRSAVTAEAEQMITSGGELVGHHDWGLRRMAYEIDHRPEAEYHLYQFHGDNELLERLRHSLRIMDGVLRFRIIRLKPGTPPPPPPREASPRREEREPTGRVAARAAADAPADAPADTPADAPADEPAEAPADAPAEPA